MSSPRPGTALLAMAAALALVGCSNKDSNAPAPGSSTPSGERTVLIGHAAPLTGPQSHLGKDNEYGAKLAIEELNAQHLTIGGQKVHFELESEDDQADPKQGTIVAQKFVDAKVNGVIGHLNSGTTMPASKIYADAGIPEISGSSTTPAYTKQGFKTAFRVMANDEQQGRALGTYATHQLGAKKIAIVDDATAYGRGQADEFEKGAKAGGATIVTREYTNDKATDFKAILTKIKSTQPDLIFFGGMDAQGGPMAKQLKELGLTAKFLTGDGGCTPEFIKLGGAATEGQYCSLPGVPLDKMPGGPAFRAKYEAKFKSQIQLYGPYVYDAVMVLVDAMKRANSVEPAKYLPEIGKTDYPGVSARIQFDAKGDLKDGAISFYQARAGKWVFQETLGTTSAQP